MNKTKRIEFRVTLSEYLIIKNKAFKTGCSISDFVRNTTMNYPVSHKLTPEELQIYEELIKYADNFRRIGNLFKLGDVTGVKEETIKTGKLIRQHLNKLQ